MLLDSGRSQGTNVAWTISLGAGSGLTRHPADSGQQGSITRQHGRLRWRFLKMRSKLTVLGGVAIGVAGFVTPILGSISWLS